MEIIKLDLNLTNNTTYFVDYDSHMLLEGIITKEENVYCSICTEINLVTEGITKEESIKNLLEAVKDYIEIAVEKNLPIYRPVPLEDNPLINDKENIIEIFKIETNVNLLEYV